MPDARASHERALRAEIAGLTKRTVRVAFDRDRGTYAAWVGSKTVSGARLRGEWTTAVGALRRLRNKIQPPLSPQVERPQPPYTFEAPSKDRITDWWPVAAAVILAVCAAMWKLMA